MLNQFSRTELIIGKEGIEKLNNAKVAIFGIGGVGSYVVEGLVRAGVQNFILVDDDKVCLTNLNRQLIATRKTVGKYKVDVMKERILSINPDAEVITHKCFFLPENKDGFDFSKYTYVVDAVDTVTAKLTIIEETKKAGVPVISSMGTGNKLDPTKFEVADISKTSVCPLAKVMRRELKKRGISHVKVVYSKEEAITPLAEDDALQCGEQNNEDTTGRKKIAPGSISFVPSVAGLIIAGEVIKDICNI